VVVVVTERLDSACLLAALASSFGALAEDLYGHNDTIRYRLLREACALVWRGCEWLSTHPSHILYARVPDFCCARAWKAFSPFCSHVLCSDTDQDCVLGRARPASGS
jgi:hypothetical protein